MITVFKRAGIAWIVLQLCWQSAAAQDAAAERPPALVPVTPAAPATPAAPDASTAARPVVPAPQAPVDPLGTAKSATAETPRTTLTITPAAAVPVAPPPTSITRSLPVPVAPADRATGIDIDSQGNVVGPNLESLKRTAPLATSSTPALRALKRLTPQEILASSHDDFAIYVLRDSERTLVLDFPNTREQSRMFARLILFIERAGASKTRVMTVPEVQKWLQANAVQLDTLTFGNNMRSGELARFFNSARFQGEPITVDEQRLYDWLVQSQVLREEESGVAVVDPEHVLVTVPQISSVPGCPGCTVSAAQRAVILQHELSHARYSTDTVYQNYTVWFWSNALSLVQRDKFTRFLRSRGYDTAIRELCANEMQAFLMHTPDPSMFSASDIGITDAELFDIRRRFADGIAPKPRATSASAGPYQFD